MDLDPVADPDPAIFVIDLQDANKKLLFNCTFTSLFKDKKSKRSHKSVRIKVFLTILLDDGRIRIRIHSSD